MFKKTLLTTISLLCLLMFANVTHASVNPDDYYARYNVLNPVSCDVDEFIWYFETENRFPTTFAFYRETSINGVVIDVWDSPNNPPFNVNTTGTTTTFVTGYVIDANYTVRFEIDFFVDGVLVEAYYIEGTCTDGIASVIYVNKMPGADVIGRLAADGRANPHPAAPIAVYVSARGELSILVINPANARQSTLVGDGGTNPYTGARIRIITNDDGSFTIYTSYADGKPYVIRVSSTGQLLEIILW